MDIFASAHSHEWTDVISEPLARVLSIEEIDALTIRAHKDGTILGITSPSMDERGVVIHKTTTGRLCWQVWSDGVVTIALYRPGAQAVALRLGADLELDFVDQHAPIYKRHWNALERTLYAIPVHGDVVAQITARLQIESAD